MKEPPAKQRLRASLLDRLEDEQPTRQLEAAGERLVDEAQLRELVRRDLTWLFNTTQLGATMDFSAYPHVQTSVLNFGLPTLTGRWFSNLQESELQTQVRDALVRFEPRLLRDTISVSVRLGESLAGTGALIIDIQAELWAEPLPLAVFLRTEVDVESGRVAIAEKRSEPAR